MEDVQALIRNTGNKADDIILTSEEDQERHLGYSKPAGTNGQGCIVLRARNIVVYEFKSKDECKIGQEDENSA